MTFDERIKYFSDMFDACSYEVQKEFTSHEEYTPEQMKTTLIELMASYVPDNMIDIGKDKNDTDI